MTATGLQKFTHLITREHAMRLGPMRGRAYSVAIYLDELVTLSVISSNLFLANKIDNYIEDSRVYGGIGVNTFVTYSH